jgi:hypothetical protein
MCAARHCSVLLAELTFDNKHFVGKRSFVHKLNQTLHFHPYTSKTTVLCAFHNSNREAVLWSNTFRPCTEKWTPHPLCWQTKLGFNSLDTWNPQSKRYWSAENHTLVRELPVQSDKCGVLWVRCANFFYDTLNSHHVTHILTTVFDHISDYERTYAFFSRTGGDERYARNKHGALFVAYELRV